MEFQHSKISIGRGKTLQGAIEHALRESKLPKPYQFEVIGHGGNVAEDTSLWFEVRVKVWASKVELPCVGCGTTEQDRSKCPLCHKGPFANAAPRSPMRSAVREEKPRFTRADGPGQWRCNACNNVTTMVKELRKDGTVIPDEEGTPTFCMTCLRAEALKGCASATCGRPDCETCEANPTPAELSLEPLLHRAIKQERDARKPKVTLSFTCGHTCTISENSATTEIREQIAAQSCRDCLMADSGVEV